MFMSDPPTGVLIGVAADERNEKIERASEQESEGPKTTQPNRYPKLAAQHLENFMDQATDKNIVKEAKQAWEIKTLDEIF